MNRQESQDRTRQRLRSSAREIFAREGIGAASIDRIADAAGFSRGAFYSNYPDKHTLALELLGDWQATEIALWKSRIGDIENPEQRIQMLQDSFNTFHKSKDRGLLALELQLHAERQPAFGERYSEYLNTLHTSIAQLLEVLFERAGRTPPAPLHILARTMRSITMGLSLQHRYAAKDDDTSNAGAMLGLFLRSIINLGDSIAPQGEET
jgi:AcrR family transcriptional regulator